MDAVAQALADPIRRDVLRMLGTRNHTAGELAGAFSVSRPAVSRHLRVLREAGLVRDIPNGREREYQLVLSALDELEAYLHALRNPTPATAATPAPNWERRFAALETEVFRVRNQRRKTEATTASAIPVTKKESA